MIKKFSQSIFVFALMLLPLTSMASSLMEDEFNQAWHNAFYTQIELEPIDVNYVLSTYYNTEPKLIFTRSMLWEVERKKAWSPEIYIAPVIEAGSGKSWGKQILADGNEVFVRSTKQRQWLNFDRYGDVFEKVFLNNKEQKAIFLGASEVTNELGSSISAHNTQALFHVEHGVAGTEERPLNTWRIVHMTSGRDEKLVQAFQERFSDKTALPVYITHYIEQDLGIKIQRK